MTLKSQGRLILVIISFVFFVNACSLQPEKPLAKFSPIEATINDVHQAFINQQLTCSELSNLYLQRIEKYDQTTKLNAIILINPNVDSRAEQLDKEYEQSKTLRPLHCIPVILKDNFDTADMPTEGGSIAMKGSLPPDDAFMVKQLRQAGAIIIAKSNMAEWAFSPYHSKSSTHGETRNAYDLDRVPAGSSGGTASAIAANFGIIGMGTDTGNSIRGPSSHLSLVGIRSTIGMTSRDGVIPLLLNRDIAGPMMRTVEDTAKVFSVIAGYDPADPVTEPAKQHNEKDYTKFLKKDGLQGARIAVLRELFTSENSNPDILSLTEKAITDLKKLGATIVDPFVIDNFQSLAAATGFCSRFRFDLNNYLLTLGKNATVKNLQEVVDNKLYDQGIAGGMQWATSIEADITPDKQEVPCVDVENDPRRKDFRDAVVNAMNATNIDAIIYPSWRHLPRKIGDFESPHGNNSPIIAPHTGLPAITVPMGFTKAGLPAGLQLLGKEFSEGKLFQYAYAYEQATQHRRPPAKFN